MMRVVTVGSSSTGKKARKNGRSYPVWLVKVYTAVRAKTSRTSRYYWKLDYEVQSLSASGNHASQALFDRAEAYAREHDIPFVRDIRQGLTVRLTTLEQVALELSLAVEQETA